MCLQYILQPCCVSLANFLSPFHEGFFTPSLSSNFFPRPILLLAPWKWPAFTIREKSEVNSNKLLLVLLAPGSSIVSFTLLSANEPSYSRPGFNPGVTLFEAQHNALSLLPLLFLLLPINLTLFISTWTCMSTSEKNSSLNLTSPFPVTILLPPFSQLIVKKYKAAFYYDDYSLCLIAIHSAILLTYPFSATFSAKEVGIGSRLDQLWSFSGISNWRWALWPV